MAHHFGPNIKLLRNRKGRTQDEAAFALQMKRSTLSGYENGVAEPSLEVLMAFSQYYKISLDTLVKVDMSTLSERQILEMEMGNDPYIQGTALRVLATTVNAENDENIELVSVKAKAGYTSGYADPEFIQTLPTFQLPFLNRDRKYRTFQLSGDSMLPIPDGSFVTAEFVQDWRQIKDGTGCVILTLNDGIVFKIVENRLDKNRTLYLRSLNPLFEPYELPASEIREVWKFSHYISSQLPEPGMGQSEMLSVLMQLQTDVARLKSKVD